MPIYEYQCDACGQILDALQKIGDAPLKKCPSCGKSKLKRLLSAPMFLLKGSGWYETDFKGDQERKRNLADRPEPDKKAGEGEGAAKAEGKEAKADKDVKGEKDGKADKEGKTAGASDAKPAAKPAVRPDTGKSTRRTTASSRASASSRSGGAARAPGGRPARKAIPKPKTRRR